MRFRFCQHIEDEPSANDACKCGGKVKPGSLFCPGASVAKLSSAPELHCPKLDYQSSAYPPTGDIRASIE